MSKKHVVIVSHYYPPHQGGIEIVASNQAKRLAAAGWNVTVITSRTTKEDVNTSENGITLRRIWAWNGLEKHGIPFPIFSFRLISELYRASKTADIIHIHDAFYLSSFSAAVVGRLLKKPIVLTQHVAMVPHASKLTMLIQKTVYATTGAYIFRSSNRITILNERVRQFLLAKGVQEEKIVWLPNGVDTDIFRPGLLSEKNDLKEKYGLPLDKPIVLFVGRFVLKKGFNKVIKAESDAFHLVLVGGTSTDQSNRNISYLGKLPQASLSEIYKLADIFILPSEGEGFPLSAQEAMASGLAIIMGFDEGYSAYKLDQQKVLLLHKPTTESVKKAIIELVQNGEKRNLMSEYSLSYARDNFSWSVVLKNLDKIYSQLVMKDNRQ